MDVRKAIEHRRSVRAYLDRPVEDADLERVVDAARLAPSGNNSQPWTFIAVRDAARRARIVEVCRQPWMSSAPVLLACVADIRRRLRDEAPLDVDENSPQLDLKRIIRDTAIAVEHAVLEAESIGLSTCWVGFYTQAAIRPVLGIPADRYVLAILTLGHPAEHPEARPRRALADILRHETWA